MKFCIRNFICEHSQEAPGSMDRTHGFKKNKIPVFHIYGVTDTGQKACLHVHGFLPYLVLRVGGKVTPLVLSAMRSKVNKGIEKEIETTTGKNSKFTMDYVYKMEQFSSRCLYGYQEEEEDFVRVYFSSPWYLQKATHALGKEVVDKPLYQPFEAHLPFHLQFFIDNSIFGMDNIHLRKVKFRLDPNCKNEDIVYRTLTAGEIKGNDQLLSPYEKVTNCHVECDAQVKDILNMEMQADNVHSSNPGLEYIWREEKERCDELGIELKDVFNSYEARKSTIWPQEREMLRAARKMAKRFREERCMSEQLDDLMTTRIAETQQTSTSSESDMTIWERNDELEEEESAVNVRKGREKTPEELDEERQKEEDREDVAEDDDNDPGNQEVEMTMITDSQRNEGGEEDDVMEVDDVEEKDPDKTIEEVEEVSSGEETGDEVINWITTKSSFDQNFISMNENLCESKNTEVIQRQFSREMTDASGISDRTVVAPAEHSQAMEQTKLLSQTSIDEPSTSEKSDSDIVGLCVASLELLVHTQKPMPNFVFDPIISISLAIYDDVCRVSTPKLHVLLTTIPNEISYIEQNVIYFETELEMVEEVIKYVIQFDVDVLVGYETVRVSWGFFFRRMKVLGTRMSMDRTRIKRDDEQQNREEEIVVEAPKGRLLVSVWKVVRSDLKLRNYDLGHAVANVLRRKLPMIDNSTLIKRIKGSSSIVRNDVYKYLLKLSSVNISLLIEMNWFLKNAEMARVYGIQFHEVWTRGSQLRVESMLLRLAHRMNFVAPSITHLQRNIMGSPEQLQLILEPQSKVYFDPVIVLDFQSLYPSMVIAYNYCYSTILGKISNLVQMTNESRNREEIILGAIKYYPSKDDLVKMVAYKEVCASPLAAMFVKKSKREGVVPLLLREILAARIMVKNAMKRVKSKKLKRILDARQLALKLVANVTYGYTAANWSGRMPCAELADAILGKGRETLERAIEMVQNGDYGGADVIYGDTDSMFVLVRGASVEEAFEIGKRIADDVTNSNPDPVVLKLEKVYKGCVLETKKRYAGWMYEHENDEGSLDAKGIETVRRDTCPIVSEVLEKGDYSPKAMVPQKKLAESRLKTCSSYITLRGERVPYVIIDGVAGSTVYSCVRSIEHFARNPDYKINTNYYLNAHILAALRRVTDLIPMKIDCISLASDQCYVTDCSRIGKTPWCIECESNPEELAMAFVHLGRENRARSQIRQICGSCQSATIGINDEQVLECSNFSCLLRQTISILDRAKTRNVIMLHKDFI
uniref:DNA polymerase n=1 Tax=Caenorhabditis tropicalis TaxID=1561998 RepID=A0A1I7T0H9_9PELO